MKTRFLSRFFFAAATAFPLASSAKETTFARANITVVNGVLTIDESDPTAFGLIFKFGSVVGVSAGEKNYQKFNPKTDVLFDPTLPRLPIRGGPIFPIPKIVA